MKKEIHPSAIIDKSAKIGKNTEIGPYTVIGPDVQIGENCVISNNCTITGETSIAEDVKVGPLSTIGVPSYFMDSNNGPVEIPGKIKIGAGCRLSNNLSIKGNTTIGESNIIGSYSTIGYLGQDKKDRIGKATYLNIGDMNEIREYVSIHCGSTEGSGSTDIGSYNLIMAYSHLAHDIKMENHCIIANNTTLAGHVEIGSHVKTGGYSGIHQFCKIGDHVMIGGLTGVAQDVAPYLLVAGARASVYGLNIVGLKRNGFTQNEIQQIQEIFTIFFEQRLPPAVAIKKIETELENTEIVKNFLDFVKASSRGILRKNNN